MTRGLQSPFPGYDADATAAAFAGGWFHSGDAAVVHPDGYIEIRDRYKDVIISGGEDISSIGYAATHPNVTVTTAAALEGLKFPGKLDVFGISRNYHDLHDEFMGPLDIAAFNRAVYRALKPGGVYVILDHSAALGAPANVTETLHRIESSTVRRDAERS